VGASPCLLYYLRRDAYGPCHQVLRRPRLPQDKYAVQEGVRPTHTVGAQARRKNANALQRTMQREWEAVHKGEQFDPEWFREHVLPGLAPLSLVTIARAAGMSTSAASRVRSGQRVPHPRHWEALAGVCAEP